MAWDDDVDDTIILYGDDMSHVCLQPELIRANDIALYTINHTWFVAQEILCCTMSYLD